MKKLIQWGILVVLALVLALPAGAAEIAIKHNGDWLEIAHVTTSAEDTAGQYYQFGEMDNLCLAQALAADCTQAQYEAACPDVETPACETFYARTAEGGKRWFMAKVIEAGLTVLVGSRESEINGRGKGHWNTLTLAEKEAQCIAWGLAADCSEL